MLSLWRCLGVEQDMEKAGGFPIIGAVPLYIIR